MLIVNLQAGGGGLIGDVSRKGAKKSCTETHKPGILFPHFDSYNLKTLIYQGIKLFFCLLHCGVTENRFEDFIPEVWYLSIIILCSPSYK